jgi:phytoene/squalene synthetase
MEVDHYENSPVASILLPKELRAPVGVIYQVARTAADIADEGVFDPAERHLNGLDRALIGVRALAMRLCGRLGAQLRSVESRACWPH